MILCVCFTSINLSVFGQASWQYFFWFNLYDIQGNKITLEEYKKGNLKLFSEPFGVYGDNKLEYDVNTKKLENLMAMIPFYDRKELEAMFEDKTL